LNSYYRIERTLDHAVKLTIRSLSSFLEYALLRLLDNQRLKAGIVYERTSPRGVAILKTENGALPNREKGRIEQ